MKKFILSLLCLCAFIFSSVSHAITINTAKINGTYYGLTGALNNPAVGVAVDLGTAMLTKANPWLTGIGLGLTVYKIAEELFPSQIVAFRPGLVSEKVDTWPSNLPPSVGTYYPPVSQYKAQCLNDACTWHDTYEAANSERCALQGWSVQNTPSYACCTSSGLCYPTYFSSQQLPASCDSGYTLDGSTCRLTNANLVKYPSDGVVSLMVDANGKFIADPRDPDGLSPNLSDIAGQSSVTQKSTDGKQSSTTTANPDGSISHSTTNEYFDSTDASTHQFTQNFTINNAGAVTNYSSSNPVIQVVNGVAQPVSSSNQVVFPSDYARVNEAQTAANSVNVKLDSLHDDLTNPGTPNTDPTVPDNGQYTDFADTFSGLTGWSMPGHSSQCPTASFVSPWGTSYTFDAHCQLIVDHWAVLQTAMTVVWTLSALFIVLKA